MGSTGLLLYYDGLWHRARDRHCKKVLVMKQCYEVFIWVVVLVLAAISVTAMTRCSAPGSHVPDRCLDCPDRSHK
jgi:hypothetical protein